MSSRFEEAPDLPCGTREPGRVPAPAQAKRGLVKEQTVAIVGGGPAGLMAAEALSQRGLGVEVFDRMPTVGRKFLLAGRGGLNLTSGQPLELFLDRFQPPCRQLQAALRAFGPEAIGHWAAGLGIETFVGTSGRVFPLDMKAAPLLRAWVNRLRRAGVRFHAHHRWAGWNPGLELHFETPGGPRRICPSAAILAAGGASWSRLGSDGAWVPLLADRGVGIAPLRPANCGFDVSWSPHFRERFAGVPVKSVAARIPGGEPRQGEFVITGFGVEGSLIYSFSAALRDEIERSGQARLWLDLLPGRDLPRLERELSAPRGSRSLSEHLRRRTGIQGVQAGLIRERLSPEDLARPERLARGLKQLPLVLTAPRPLDEAISTAGGVRFEELDEHLMLRGFPGLFCAGEMLDWEAPTGGYLLTGCLATGRRAGEGAADWLEGR